MTDALHFAWVAEGEAFDATTHARADEALRALRIEAEEGGAPRARVTIANAGHALQGPNGERFVHLSTTLNGSVIPLFHGVLAEVPDGMAGAFLTLLFDSRHGDMNAKTEAALTPYKIAPAYDPLFIVEGEEEDPSEILEGWFARLTVDRLTGAVGVSDGLTGRKSQSFGPETLAEGSIDLTRPQSRPPAWVEGTLDVRWTQRGGGVADIGTLIAREARGALVTLSPPEDFADGWPQAGDRIGGDSGYRVLEGVLVTQEPPALEEAIAANPFARFTEDDRVVTIAAGRGLGTQGDFDFGPTEARSSLFPMGRFAGWMAFAKRAYWPILTLAWSLSQRRKQIAVLRLDSHLAIDFPGPEEGESLSFHLRDVGLGSDPAEEDATTTGPDCDSILSIARNTGASEISETAAVGVTGGAVDGAAIGDTLLGSFLHTSRGRLTLAHMARVLAVRLAFAQRCIRVSARLPGWSAEALSVDLDTTVTLKAATLPGGQATGKVVSVVLSWDETGREVALEIACSIGGGGTMAAPDPGLETLTDAYTDDYAARTGEVWRTELGDHLTLSLGGYDDQLPTDPLAAAATWGAEDLLAGLCLRNLWDEQDAAIWAHRNGGLSPRRLLASVPTDVCLSLRSLAASDQRVHGLTIAAAGRFGLPPTIDLEAPRG
ncbi:MAG: hypothetical protein K9H25_16280 [Rhodospirillum sp.]|nr:hypothetical protein [Rhodospirillum sp.]MCF8489636.1 hypothetical protein [Rhodospirillum sp.]